MNRFGKFLFIGLLAVASASILTAQRPNPPKDQNKRVLEQSDKLAKELELDEDQKALVQALLFASSDKMINVRNQTQDREKMRLEFKNIRDEQNELMKDILSEAQYTKYIEIQQENVRKMRRDRRPEDKKPDQN